MLKVSLYFRRCPNRDVKTLTIRYRLADMLRDLILYILQKFSLKFGIIYRCAEY
jgi:hypothetical protein